MEFVLPDQITFIVFDKAILTPHKPTDWNVFEEGTLFENITARYVWRYMLTKTRNRINKDVWLSIFELVLNQCWYNIQNIHDVITAAWHGKSLQVWREPKFYKNDTEKLYNLAMSKLQRRKTAKIQRYEGVDEYVDNIYLHE